MEAYIISNDQYRQYQCYYPKGWIDNHRIEYMIIGNFVYYAKPKSKNYIVGVQGNNNNQLLLEGALD